MTNWRSALSLTAALFLLGALLTVSFYNQERSRVTAPRQTELVEAVEKLADDRSNLQKRLSGLRAELSREQHRAAAARGSLDSFASEEKVLKSEAGLSPVSGAGLRITLSDARVSSAEQNPDDLIIHDYDLLAVINVLWSAGAKAIAVNDARVISTTAVRSAGSTILINSHLLGSPYRIEAIGSGKSMQEALARDSQTAPLLGISSENIGLKGAVEHISSLTLPAYSGSLNFVHAKVSGRPN